jgi:ZipA, C-terminal FtsZ-binding domain
MSELRWTLLILGVVFLAALSWWERRRPHQAFAPHLRDANLSRGEARRTALAQPAPGPEPWIGEDGLSDVVSADMSFTDTEEEGEAAHDRSADTPVQSAAPGPLADLPIIIADADERLALAAAWNDQPPEPRLIDPDLAATGELPALPFDEEVPGDVMAVGDAAALGDATAEGDATAAGDAMPANDVMEARDAAEAPSAATPTLPHAANPAERLVAPVRSVLSGESDIPGAEGVGAVRTIEPAPIDEGATRIQVIVEWPPEESRRILALRLVAPQPARFPGRTLRLALAAEGFLLGKFSIFHKPDETNRALLSAASLNRPGSFDLDTMDSQRYGGLSLFIVLPGPRTPQHAFEELLSAARNLNERLEGALQDERGGPLTPLRVASIRESLRIESTLLPTAAHGT